MYDMYPWDSRAEGAQNSPAPRPRPRPREAGQAAVQVALDRRDNWGEPADEAK